jgi:hypothetical protein
LNQFRERWPSDWYTTSIKHWSRGFTRIEIADQEILLQPGDELFIHADHPQEGALPKQKRQEPSWLTTSPAWSIGLGSTRTKVMGCTETRSTGSASPRCKASAVLAVRSRARSDVRARAPGAVNRHGSYSISLMLAIAHRHLPWAVSVSLPD